MACCRRHTCAQGGAKSMVSSKFGTGQYLPPNCSFNNAAKILCYGSKKQGLGGLPFFKATSGRFETSPRVQMFFGLGEVSTRPFSRKDLKDGGGDPLPGVSAGIRLKFRSCTVAGDKILHYFCKVSHIQNVGERLFCLGCLLCTTEIYYCLKADPRTTS